MEREVVTVRVHIGAAPETVWDYWTNPKHIVNWNFAADSWQCPRAENDVRPGGQFCWRMEAKDGSMGFDYAGTYRMVQPFSRISKSINDGRAVVITLREETAGTTLLTESFEVEGTNEVEPQRQGWQAILNNFKQYVEANR
ncbi:SRPBCC domain-containing protein [Lewinella sp. W8]|uniref:SRPBCC domain-containing protein n=1 Tax=Lewinella sp. W8 TaxID=2528208 RepID=UPI0010686F99|nr:SRPBCC domain-containing protein [Lewinella sp. W8]MTB52244.1 polyketide cyclase [Lewinella sp. W8]